MLSQSVSHAVTEVHVVTTARVLHVAMSAVQEVHVVTTEVQRVHVASVLLRTTSRTTNQKCSNIFPDTP
jgi:hypothetical protein